MCGQRIRRGDARLRNPRRTRYVARDDRYGAEGCGMPSRCHASKRRQRPRQTPRTGDRDAMVKRVPRQRSFHGDALAAKLGEAEASHNGTLVVAVAVSPGSGTPRLRHRPRLQCAVPCAKTASTHRPRSAGSAGRITGWREPALSRDRHRRLKGRLRSGRPTSPPVPCACARSRAGTGAPVAPSSSR